MYCWLLIGSGKVLLTLQVPNFTHFFAEMCIWELFNQVFFIDQFDRSFRIEKSFTQVLPFTYLSIEAASNQALPGIKY